MRALTDRAREPSSNSQEPNQQNVANLDGTRDPATRRLDVHLYIDAHTKLRLCCCCKKKKLLGPQRVRYWCRSCYDASLCEDCAKDSTRPDHQGIQDRKIDLSRIVQVRRTLKHAAYKLTEQDRLLLEPTEENQTYVTQLISQLGLRQDFCVGCMDFSPGNVDQVWRSQQILHLSDLKNAGEAGCATCSLAYRGVLKIAPERVKMDDRVKWKIRPHQIKIVTIDSLKHVHRNYVIWANPGQPKPWETIRYAPFQTAGPRSKENFKTIRSWINSCETSHPHEQCARQGDALLPKRVVYIQSDHAIQPGQGSTFLSLHEPVMGAVGKYIALSHCWGTERLLTTTRTNFSKLCQRFEMSDLPLTFRHAVHCAKGLGIQYLWIDSLCIIQDDVRDWEVESAKMSSIYSDAYLVVAAGTSSSGQGGMLFERPAIMRGRPIESREGSGMFDLVIQGEVPHAKRHFPSTVARSPISSRAWCMQELILARRSVSFFREEIIWECHSRVECECGTITSSSPSSETADMNNYEHSALWLDPKDALFGDIYTIKYKRKPYNMFADRKTIINEWRHITVPEYTARSITKPTDRLPAAAGIASLIATRYNEEYLAGIWRSDLKCGLMWSVPRSKQLAPAPGDYTAPSFSWASVNTKVEYICSVPFVCDPESARTGAHKFAYGKIKSALLEANVEPSGANPLGCVKVGSYIRLRGWSMRFTLRSKDGKYTLAHLDQSRRDQHPGGPLSFRPDCLLREVNTCSHTANGLGRGPVKSVNRSKVALGPGISDDFEAEVDGLVLADFHKFLGQFSSNCCAFILLGVSTSHDDSYERLGLGSWRYPDDEVEEKWTRWAEERDYKII